MSCMYLYVASCSNFSWFQIVQVLEFGSGICLAQRSGGIIILLPPAKDMQSQYALNTTLLLFHMRRCTLATRIIKFLLFLIRNVWRRSSQFHYCNGYIIFCMPVYALLCLHLYRTFICHACHARHVCDDLLVFTYKIIFGNVYTRVCIYIFFGVLNHAARNYIILCCILLSCM